MNATSIDAGLAPPRAQRRPFAEVAAAELDSVYRFLVYLTGDRAAAEDLTGETFERAFRGWRRFDPRRGSPLAYLCSIARSAALDWFRAEERRRRREEAYTRGSACVHIHTPGEGLSEVLDRALKRLEERLADVRA